MSAVCCAATKDRARNLFRPNGRRVLADLDHLLVKISHPRTGRRIEKCTMQRGPAHTAPSAGREWRVYLPDAVGVADPRKGLPSACTRRRSSCRTMCGIRPSPQASSISPLRRSTTATSSPARAPRTRWPVRPDRRPRQAGPSSQARQPAFSTSIRALSSAALSIENTTAVIRAACTNGSATPSAITAT